MAAQLVFGAGSSSTFGSTGTAAAATASFSKSALSNIVIGDLLVAVIHNQDSLAGDTITAPNNWIRYGAALGTPNSSTSRLTGIYYYSVKSQADIDSIPATVTWTFTSPGSRSANVVARATGIDLNNIEDSASASFTSSNTASLAIPGITTISATTLLVSALHHQNSASTTSPSVTALQTAFLEYKTSPTGSANANTGAVLGYHYLTTAGATGTVTATFDTAVTTSGGEIAAFKAGAWAPTGGTVTRPTIVGVATTSVSTSAVTSFTINAPTGYQNGDALVLALSGQSSTATADYSSTGWTRVSQSFTASSAGFRIVAFYCLPVPTAASVTASSYIFTSTDSASGGRVAAEMFIVRGADLSNFAVATSPYGTTSSQVTSVQPGTPSVANNLLLVAYNAQFTSAIDYTVATGPSGMIQQTFLPSSTTAVSKTILAVYQQNIESGAVSSEALTWNGALSQGSGVALIIRSLGVITPNNGLAISFTSTTDTLASGHLFYTSAVDTITTPKEIRPVPTGYPSVTAMLGTSPFYVAHRGGDVDWPEESLYSYTQTAFWGCGALELSLARTSDGVWFGLHDATLDRTSGTSGFTASAHTWAEVQQYQISAATTTNSSQPARPYMRWEELMTAYYNTHVIFVDPKVASAYTAELLNMMDAMGNTPTNRFVGKYYGVSGPSNNASGWAHDLSARGYQSWGYFYQADAPNYAAYQGRWTILGMDYTANQASWTSILSYGKPVIGHIVPSAAGATTALNFGAAGLMVSGVQEIIPRI